MSKNLVRALLALAGALIAAVVLTLTTKQPTLVPVAVVSAAVAPGQALQPADLTRHEVLAPAPTGSFPAPSAAAGLIAQVPLEPGQTLVRPDVGRTYDGVPQGMVRIVVPVSAGQSALVAQGERVDVLGALQRGTTGATNTAVLASHVLVLATYGANGAAIVGTATAPQFVALAVTPKQVATVLPYLTQSGATSYWLVLDPAGVL